MRRRIFTTFAAGAALALAMSVAYADDEIEAGAGDTVTDQNVAENAADHNTPDQANTPAWVADVKANGGPPAWVADLKTTGGPPAWLATQRSPNAHPH
jgi:hypothetical protein